MLLHFCTGYQIEDEIQPWRQEEALKIQEIIRMQYLHQKSMNGNPFELTLHWYTMDFVCPDYEHYPVKTLYVKQLASHPESFFANMEPTMYYQQKSGVAPRQYDHRKRSTVVKKIYKQ